MKRFFRKVHRTWYLLWVFVFFVLFYPLLWWSSKKPDKRYIVLVRLRRVIALLGASMAGLFYRVRSQQRVDWSRTYIICPNHTSNLDITAVMHACRNDFSFMGKEELLQNPVTGLFFKTVDIPVNRSSKISSFRAFKKAQNLLMEGKSVVIFPEGHISDTFPPHLQPFKNGVFKLALDLKIPILPVVIHNAWQVFWDDGKAQGTRPGIIDITLLEPIETQDYKKTAEDLRDAVFIEMQKEWAQMRSVTKGNASTLIK